MKSFNEWRKLYESNQVHPLWWKVYKSMIDQDPEYMKYAPSERVQELSNQTLIGSKWNVPEDDERQIDMMAEYLLGMLKSKNIR